MPFVPELLITDTGAWNVSHRVDSALPGYLIISSKTPAEDLSELPQDALRELGPLLATAQVALRQQLGARLVYIGRYGHVPDQPFHFHIVPVYQWVEELFWQDGRYRALQQFAEADGATTADGAELTLFIWREFCERAHPPQTEGPSVREVIDLLRKTMHLPSAMPDAPSLDAELSPHKQ